MKNPRSYDSFYDSDSLSVPHDITLNSTIAQLGSGPGTRVSQASQISSPSAYSPTIAEAESGRVLPLPEFAYDATIPRPRPPRSIPPPPRPVNLVRRWSVSSLSSMQYANGFSTLDILIDVPLVSQEEAERTASQNRVSRTTSKGTLDRLLDFVASLYMNTRRLLYCLLFIMIATFICSIVGIYYAKRK